MPAEQDDVELEREPPCAPRVHTLRLSVTDRCNLRCRYCMPAEGVVKVGHYELLRLEELAGVARALAGRLAIERIKLTGGEPLVRKGLPALVRMLREIPGIREVSLTTNGTLLRRLAGALKEAGLSRVNVSLDSLDAERFAEITRGGRLTATLDGIEAALEAGLLPVKLNAVLRRSEWRRDIPALMDFAAAKGLEIRFIELMRTGTEHAWCEDEYVAAEEVEEWLARRGTVEPAGNSHAGPARGSLTEWHGNLVRLGWITPRSHPFCSECDRLRMDCRGRVYRCLMDNESLGYAELLHSMDEETAWAVLRDYLGDKRSPAAMVRDSSMASIGG